MRSGTQLWEEWARVRHAHENIYSGFRQRSENLDLLSIREHQLRDKAWSSYNSVDRIKYMNTYVYGFCEY